MPEPPTNIPDLSATPAAASSVRAAQFEEFRPLALVIDDSTDVHRLLRVRLRPEGLELVGASSGPEGIRAAQTQRPSVILLDLDMPGMDGFEVLRALKDAEDTLHIPVIVISSLQSPHDKVTAFDLGAIDYITKPFDLTELRVRVRSALRLSEMVQMLAQRAQIDGLTGLWNRAHFDKRWAEEVSTATRHGRPLSLAILDLDHFKSVNDNFGHPAGDAVLQSVAKLLQRECRESDIPCRFGGEEFALVMPETSTPDALSVCERVRVTLEGITWPRHPDRRVTVSVGLVGSQAKSGATASRWFELADRCLYRAKEQGRNQVVHSDLSTGPRLAKAG